MSNTHFSRAHTPRRRITIATTFAWAALLLLHHAATPTMAAGWNGIEPLKSRRADAERILGKPLQNQPGETGTLRFKVAGGTVTLLFVNARFVASKKIQPELEGTVLQIVLQHERATDTADSLGLLKNSDFTREDNNQGTTVFRNLKDGLYYTFVGGRLATSRFSPTADQLASVQIKG
ncbi:MAG: hypothetical protein M3430_11540 [Acidobacteriota bacterium]|nr:hypothetical protein [Acidobacteriota bacterium]